jgi:hypothetical protein
MRNAIDDTLYNINQGREKPTKGGSFTVGNGPNKGVKITLRDGDEARRTSGQASGVEKREDNMHCFFCNSPSDT